MVASSTAPGIAPAIVLAVALTVWAVASAAADGVARPGPAGDDVLVGQRARHPLSATVGVPEAASRTFGQRALRVSVERGSAFMGGTARDGEMLLLDGETSELAVRLRLPIGRCTAAETRLAAIAHGGGRFDAAIESWHGVFGLPNGGREDAPRDRLAFAHVGSDGARAGLRRDASGLADAQVAFAWAPGCGRRLAGDDAVPVLRVGVELPTGDEGRWLGNGAADLWADAQSPVLTLGREWPTRVAASIGVVLPGAGQRLPPPVDIAAYGALGARVALSERWALGATLDWHTPLYDSSLTELGRGAAQLGTGVDWTRPGLGTFGIAILEDVLIDTASDFAVRLTFELAPRAAR